MKTIPIVDTQEQAEKLLRGDHDRVIIRTDEPFWILVRNDAPWQRVPAPKLPPQSDD